MTDKQIRIGFFCAGATNITGALGASMVFTNPYLAEADPAAMSNFGLVAIILWGLAYIVTAYHWREMRWLVAVFCLEKLLYVAHWLMWISAHRDSLGSLFERDFMSGLFLIVYGPTDLLFALFFASVFLKASKEPAS